MWRVWPPVIVIGHPQLALRPFLTEGTLLDRPKPGELCRTTIHGFGGNSGSPVLTPKGEAVGVVVQGYDHGPILATQAESLLALLAKRRLAKVENLKTY